jgi:hypothetical protein
MEGERNNYKHMIRIFWVLTIVLLLSGCSGSVLSELILYDFESDSELEEIHWNCHTMFSLADKHVTHGAKSLIMEMYPSDYPGWRPVHEIDDWRGFEMLCFDVFNPGEKTVPVSVRIDDRDDDPDYGNRYNKSFLLEPGMNEIRIPLDTLITTRNQRKMDLYNIESFMIFMARPEGKVVLFLDYVRLVS